MKTLEWFNLYGESWQGEITPESFSHPAKFSRSLIRKIYQHMLAEGYLAPGMSVVDPFGGVALGGLDAMRYGLNWTGIELEPKFVDLGQKNIELWNGRYRHWFDTWGTAVLLQGDSRNLAAILREAGGSVSSPPFQGSGANDSRPQGGLKDKTELHDLKIYTYGQTPGQLGSMKEGSHDAAIADGSIGSPPYVSALSAKGDGIDWAKGKDGRDFSIEPGQAIRLHMSKEYGSSPGQLGSMPPGNLDAALADGSLSSPPYAETVGKGDGPGQRWDSDTHKGDNATKNSSAAEYGRTEGNLGNMDGSVGSPPFERSEGSHSARKYSDPEAVAEDMAQKYKNGTFKGHTASKEAILKSLQRANGQTYGDTTGNIGNDQGDNFWSAARVIVEQLYTVLKPGAYSAWVTGNFRRNGEIVDFGRQWLALCEACGFVGVEHITVWKVERRGTQLDVFGNAHSKDVSRVSFFRRLDNAKNPGQEIESEDVWIVQKPL